MPAYWRGEEGRWPLWLPVGLGLGAALYFAAPVEPSATVALSALAAGALMALVAAFGWMRVLAGLLCALLLGFGLAKLREMAVATPVLDRAMVAHMTARVVSLEPRAGGTRVVLDQVRSGAFPGTAPRRVRVSLRGADFHPGDWLSPVSWRKVPKPLNADFC